MILQDEEEEGEEKYLYKRKIELTMYTLYVGNLGRKLKIPARKLQVSFVRITMVQGDSANYGTPHTRPSIHTPEYAEESLT